MGRTDIPEVILAVAFLAVIYLIARWTATGSWCRAVHVSAFVRRLLLVSGAILLIAWVSS
jgi:hypothetical protein